MKQNKQQTKHRQSINSISIGAIGLESTTLSMDQLLHRVVAILNEPTLREYLKAIKLSGGLGSASYTG
jgi:hypothetical protein